MLILRELATHAPTLIYTYVPQYLDSIWSAIRDTKQIVREAAAEALRACLALLILRETGQRTHWYARILDEAENGIKMSQTEAIHGSLLTYRELLLGTGMFMNDNFSQVCDEVLRFKDHKDSLVRRTVVHLIPVFAQYDPANFCQFYLERCMQHLMVQLKKGDKENGIFMH